MRCMRAARVDGWCQAKVEARDLSHICQTPESVSKQVEQRGTAQAFSLEWNFIIWEGC